VVKDLQEKGLIRAERRKILLLDRQTMSTRSASRVPG
jgi:hypothetical protein